MYIANIMPSTDIFVYIALDGQGTWGALQMVSTKDVHPGRSYVLALHIGFVCFVLEYTMQLKQNKNLHTFTNIQIHLESLY